MALALRRRIVDLEDATMTAVERDELAMAAQFSLRQGALEDMLLCWEAPDATQAEVLEYGERRNQCG